MRVDLREFFMAYADAYPASTVHECTVVEYYADGRIRLNLNTPAGVTFLDKAYELFRVVDNVDGTIDILVAPHTVGRFCRLLQILNIAFNECISESQYHTIVTLVRSYGADRERRCAEEDALRAIGWPLSYHPCDHMENLRFGFCFVGEDNIRLEPLLGRSVL